MSTEVEMIRIMLCDVCVSEQREFPLIAFYDMKTRGDGRWGYLCGKHVDSHGLYSEDDLGTGKGQRLIYPEELVNHYLEKTRPEYQ